MELINELFPFDVDEILYLSAGVSMVEDSLMWHHSLNGYLSIKSCYFSGFDVSFLNIGS